MIVSDFLYFDEKGLFCPYGNFYIDPKKPVNKAIISHAHADHCVKGHHDFFSTPETAILAQRRMGINAAKNFIPHPYNIKFLIGDIHVNFLPAGHILGSAQVMMEYRGIRYLYTGDCKLQSDSTCLPYQVAATDVLITETTYAKPEIIHPDVVQEILKLNNIQLPIFLGTYALGKSQRLNRLISEHCPNKLIAVHHHIAKINAVYEECHINIGTYTHYSRKLQRNNLIYMMPPAIWHRYTRSKDIAHIFVTGWNYKKKDSMYSLTISDHIDWNDLLEIIQKSKCREIWTLHGDGNTLKNYFKNQITVKILN